MKKILLLLLLIFPFTGCNEDDIVSRIPLANVNIELDLNFEDRELIGAYVYKSFIRGKERSASSYYGFGGVVVFNRGDEMLAYDLACPNEVSRDVCVVPENSGLATCPKCKAVYHLNSNGSPASGSEYYLRQYRVSPTGGNRYLVSH